MEDRQGDIATWRHVDYATCRNVYIMVKRQFDMVLCLHVDV